MRETGGKKRPRNVMSRLFLIILAAIPLIYFKEFYQHFHVYLTGNIITEIVTREWHVVVFCILLFVAFLVPLSYRRKTDWVEYGIVTAFFISSLSRCMAYLS